MKIAVGDWVPKDSFFAFHCMQKWIFVLILQIFTLSHFVFWHKAMAQNKSDGSSLLLCCRVQSGLFLEGILASQKLGAENSNTE